MQESDQVRCHQCLAYKSALYVIAVSVAKLWQSVLSGMHDSRSLVGDETLRIKEEFDRLDMPLPLKTGEKDE